MHKVRVTICGCFVILALALPPPGSADPGSAASNPGSAAPNPGSAASDPGSAAPNPGSAGVSPASKPGGKPIEGLFYGTALESGKLKKIETRITRKSSDGSLQGEYTLHQPQGRPIKGRLIEQQSLKDHHLIFKWADSTGSGIVDMIFDNTGSAFKGRWSTDDGSVKDLPWDGRRLNASANWDGITPKSSPPLRGER